MFSHIVLGSNDIAATKIFFDAALGALGIEQGKQAPSADRVVYQNGSTFFLITKPFDGQAATFANGGTIGLTAPSKEAVDAFYAAGIKAGGTDAGAPGPREAIPGSYAAYLRDPTGNKLVAWCMPES